MSMKLSGKALVVQIGETETRVACLTLGAKVPHIQASAVIPTPAGAVEDGAIKNLEAMRDALNALRIQPEFASVRKVLFVLTSTQVISHVAAVPFMKNTKKLPQLLAANADTYFPVDTSDYQLTWQVIGEKEEEGGKQTLVQLWATPKTLLGRYYLLARDCGLSVAAIDYCGNSFAHGINASFVMTKPVKAKKDKAAEEAAEDQPQVNTTLFINLDQDHVLMTFVQEGQVLMQRLLQRSDYTDADLNDIFMEIEYFHTEFPACVFGDCVVSGSGVEDVALMAGLEEVVTVPLQRLHCEPDQIWCICLGASLTELDFGDPMLDVKGSRKVNLHTNIPLQPVLLVLALLVFAGVMGMHTTVSKTWESELQSLRNQQQMLMAQASSVSGYADHYAQYAAGYDAYSNDWDNLFQSVRTYNDNAGLILEELESVLPKDAVVTNLTMNENSLTVNTAFQEKEDAAYFLIALRNLKYATLDGVSDLQDLRAAMLEEAQNPAGLGNSSALMGILSSIMSGSSEAAPTEGSFEAAPTEGDDILADLLASKALLEAMLGNKTQEELLNSPMADRLTYEQKTMLIQMKDKYDNGKLDIKNLTVSEVEALKAAMNAVLNPDSNKPSQDTNGSDSSSGSNDSAQGTTGSSKPSQSGTGSGSSSGSKPSQSGTGSSTVRIPAGEERKKLVEKYDLTEQDLKDGLDNLDMSEMRVLDKHYVNLYEKYSYSALVKDGATMAQRQAALRKLLQHDPLAMHQFFILVQEDLDRRGSGNMLTQDVNPGYWKDAANKSMFYNSDQDMLDAKLPELMNMLLKNKESVEATENLVKTNHNLTRKLAGYLAAEMGKETSYTSALDFSKLQEDILSAKTKRNVELNRVVQRMLTPTAQAYYETIPLTGVSSGSTDTSTGIGSSISDLLNQWLEANAGSGTGSSGSSNAGSDVVLQEPAGNYGITVTLGYSDALIQAEQVRKGLDYTAKIADPVEVAG